MEMPKPVGFVLVKTRGDEGHWYVPPPEVVRGLTVYVDMLYSLLRQLRLRRLTRPVDVVPRVPSAMPKGHQKPLRVQLMSEAPLSSLEEYPDLQLGCEGHPPRFGCRTFFCFQMHFFGDASPEAPLVSARLFLHPDEKEMRSFTLTGCGLLYRSDEYVRYLEGLLEAVEPDEPAGQDRVDESVQELGALVRAHYDRENEEILRDLNKRAAALLARLEGVALPEDQLESVNPNPRKYKPN
jgi:hypothetical protein